MMAVDPSVSTQLQQLAHRENLTAYGISTKVSAKIDPTPTGRRRIERRWQGVLKGENFKIQRIEEDLAVLGYRLKIERL